MNIINRTLADNPDTEMVAMKSAQGPNFWSVYQLKVSRKLGCLIALDVFAYNSDSAIGAVRTIA